MMAINSGVNPLVFSSGCQARRLVKRAAVQAADRILILSSLLPCIGMDVFSALKSSQPYHTHTHTHTLGLDPTLHSQLEPPGNQETTSPD